MAINENIPLYFKMYHKLKQSIISGEFEKGSKIGVISDLAKHYGVAQETMRRALYLLETEGLLIKKQGVGTIIPESANLSPIELGQLITRKKVLHTLLGSKVFIQSGEWVKPGYRLEQLYGLEPGAPQNRVFRIFLKMDVNYSPGLKGLMTQHVSEGLYKHLGLNESVDPFGVLIKLAEWLETEVSTVSEVMRPHLCTDEDAKLLGLPDGTPVFHQEFFVRDRDGRPHFWEFESTANIHAREMEIG
ncbi:MAG: GntR family transcriptional regulator [Syntrophobacteraceae bacterium]